MTEIINSYREPDWADVFAAADSGLDGAEFALGLTDMIIETKPEALSDAMVRVARFVAFRTKGIQVLRDVGFLRVDIAEPEDLRQYMTNEHLNFLERSLQEFAALQTLGEKEVTEKLLIDVDSVAYILEKCRPGRVHAILGWTKLMYFGLSRLGIMDYVKENLPSKQRRPFLQMPFSFPLPFKSALAFNYGYDAHRGLYISFMLISKLLSDLGPNDKVGDHSVGTLTLYENGSFDVRLEGSENKWRK
jgi:hypothetical protein